MKALGVFDFFIGDSFIGDPAVLLDDDAAAAASPIVFDVTPRDETAAVFEDDAPAA